MIIVFHQHNLSDIDCVALTASRDSSLATAALHSPKAALQSTQKHQARNLLESWRRLNPSLAMYVCSPPGGAGASIAAPVRRDAATTEDVINGAAQILVREAAKIPAAARFEYLHSTLHPFEWPSPSELTIEQADGEPQAGSNQAQLFDWLQHAQLFPMEVTTAIDVGSKHVQKLIQSNRQLIIQRLVYSWVRAAVQTNDLFAKAAISLNEVPASWTVAAPSSAASSVTAAASSPEQPPPRTSRPTQIKRGRGRRRNNSGSTQRRPRLDSGAMASPSLAHEPKKLGSIGEDVRELTISNWKHLQGSYPGQLTLLADLLEKNKLYLFVHGNLVSTQTRGVCHLVHETSCLREGVNETKSIVLATKDKLDAVVAEQAAFNERIDIRAAETKTVLAELTQGAAETKTVLAELTQGAAETKTMLAELTQGAAETKTALATIQQELRAMRAERKADRWPLVAVVVMAVAVSVGVWVQRIVVP